MKFHIIEYVKNLTTRGGIDEVAWVIIAHQALFVLPMIIALTLVACIGEKP